MERNWQQQARLRIVPLLFLLIFLSLPICGHCQTLLANPTGAYVVGGFVLSSVVQDDGKVVIGGSFVAVNGVARAGIARLNPDGTVDASWNPGDTAYIYPGTKITALAAYGNTIYVGGNFSTIGGEPRNMIGALDVTTGLATPWDPGASSQYPVVNSIAVTSDGNTVFVGGSFTNMGGAARANIAAIAAIDGGALPQWNPGADQQVMAFAIAGNTLYISGFFSMIGNQQRSYLAAVDVTSGTVLDWSPQPDGSVWAFAVSGGTMYVTGIFQNIGGQFRQGCAAIDTMSGLAVAWYPSIYPRAVSTIALDGDNIYLGGSQQRYSSPQSPGYLAKVSQQSGAILAWSPTVDGAVVTLALSGSNLFAGGYFVDAQGQQTGGLAKIDTNTAAVAASQLSGDYGTIAAMQAQTDGKIIVGGSFTSIGNIARNNIARLNHDGTLDTAWDPGVNVDGPISTLQVAGNNVYVAGNFLNIGQHFRQRLAAIDLNSGIATTWQPDPDGTVSSITVAGNTVYAGGNFQHIGNASKPYLAALDATTGLALSWSANASGPVMSSAMANNLLYVGGAFQSIGGQSRSSLAALDPATGNATSWNPIVDAPVTTLLTGPQTIYLAGDFTQVNATQRYGLASVDFSSGLITNWNPNDSYNLIQPVIAWVGGDIAVGGAFYELGGQTRRHLAIVDSTIGSATSWHMSVNDNTGSYYSNIPVTALAWNGDSLFIGGHFDSVGGQTRGSVAAITASDIIFKNGFE